MANKSGALSVLKIQKMKESGEKIAMVTAYDYPTAQMADAAGLDIEIGGILPMSHFAIRGSESPWSTRPSSPRKC